MLLTGSDYESLKLVRSRTSDEVPGLPEEFFRMPQLLPEVDCARVKTVEGLNRVAFPDRESYVFSSAKFAL
jgi:hypothetical protein